MTITDTRLARVDTASTEIPPGDDLPIRNASERPDRGGENVRAVGRALDILLAFEAQDMALSAGELVKRVGLSRPTLYRLLYTLEERGFVSAVGDPLRFRLGPSVGRLMQIWNSRASEQTGDSDPASLQRVGQH